MMIVVVIETVVMVVIVVMTMVVLVMVVMTVITNGFLCAGIVISSALGSTTAWDAWSLWVK